MQVPLVLTVAIEENAFQFFNALKKIYSPSEDNFPDAHLALFQLLPNDPLIIETIETISKEYKTMCLKVKAPCVNDNAVIYEIECPELTHLHERLQKQWNDFLVPEDLQQSWSHIIVQNKIAANAAGELLQFLNENFSAFHTWATGLQLWEYNGGPKKLLKQFDFDKN